MAKDSDTIVSDGGRNHAHHLDFQKTSKDGNEHHSWFRGEHTNKTPKLDQLFSVQGMRDYVLHGFLPEEPPIDEATQITAFGSCFASNISGYLARRNFAVAGREGDDNNAYVIRCGEGMVNTFVIRQQFEWAWENRTFEGELWHGYKAEAYGYDEEVRKTTKAIFDRTDVFILTLGLSEVWYDEPTGNVFWRTIPKDVYDPERHRFRVASVSENKDNIAAICALIRKHRPEAKIVLTLSPIPLIATFRDQSCLASNEVSKATLRVALDEFLRENPGAAYYWPSYEIVRQVFDGGLKEDMRHPDPTIINFIMSLFELTWCKDRADKVDVNTRLAMAHVASGRMLPFLGRILRRRDTEALKEFMDRKNVANKLDDDCEAAVRDLLAEIEAEWERVPKT